MTKGLFTRNKLLTKEERLISINFPFYDKNCFSFTQE